MRNPLFAHATQRKPIWLRRGTGCLGMCVCATIIALALALFAFPDTLANLQQWLGFRSESRAVEFVPNDVLMFVSLNPSFAELQRFAKLKPIFENNSAYADKLNEWVQAVTPGAGAEFERDMLPWVGTELAIALVDVPTKKSGEQSTTPNFIFMAPTRDRSKSDAAIARIRLNAEKKDWAFSEETYQGASISSSKPPTGTLLAASDADTNVWLWRVNDGSLLREVKGPNQGRSRVAFSADSSLLATGGYATVLLWRMSDGSLVKELTGQNDAVEGLAFSADSTLLASGSDDGTIGLWDVAP